MLQRIMQGLYRRTPLYKIVQVTFFPYYSLYLVLIIINKRVLTFSKGFSKRDAEQNVAKKILGKLFALPKTKRHQFLKRVMIY